MDKKSVQPLEELLDSVRDIDGFPIGKDKDILALSDPPFYTACPNPYIGEFIEEYGTPYDAENDDYEREPFVTVVSEGKNDAIYNAHSYHTKVPHKAIMQYIKHYTEPDDIVFDGFCGSGMTGVAAQILGRRVILSDLSLAATFIAQNYNNYVNLQKFLKEAKELIRSIENEYGWVYETNHTINSKNFGEKGYIHYTIWSDIYICPYCKNEHVFWNEAVDQENKRVLSEYKCPNCDAEIKKRDCENAKEKIHDSILENYVIQTKRVPVLINYSIGKKRFEKKPDADDLKVIEKINDIEIPYWFPTDRMPEGDESRRNDKYGITHIHHFYTKRNLLVLSALLDKCNNNFLKFDFLNTAWHGTLMRRYNPRGGHRPLSGTLYVPQLPSEANMINVFEHKIRMLKKFLDVRKIPKFENRVSSQSITDLRQIPNNSIDYMFTDPPFGSNLMYSELNFLWEAWLKVFTNNKNEAVVNITQNKGLDEYTELMTSGFTEMFRILKPNRWITIVFHNSKAAVWNSIQESIARSGFIIAQVSTLDKKQGSFKQVTSAGAVKNDLIINAYKPKEEFSRRFIKNAGEEMEIDFVKEQLGHLPIRPNIGRTEQMLYSKTLAHYVENGFKIRYNSINFFTLLSDNFIELDGYWFLDDQVKEYNEWKSGLSLDQLKDVLDGQQVLLISDEKSALTWIYNFLNDPKEYGDIFTAYQQVTTTSDDEIPELREILDNNFIIEKGKYRRPMDQKEREMINKNREKELDRAFKKLLEQATTQKGRIKNIRREALVHGFTKCYQEGKYHDILTIADKLYASTLESSGDIMDFVDIARIKTSGE